MLLLWIGNRTVLWVDWRPIELTQLMPIMDYNLPGGVKEDDTIDCHVPVA